MQVLDSYNNADDLSNPFRYAVCEIMFELLPVRNVCHFSGPRSPGSSCINIIVSATTQGVYLGGT